MKIPSVNDNIRNMMSEGTAKSLVDRSRMSEGQQMFTKADIQKSKGDLDVELRYMFSYFKIGKSYFNDKAVEYYQRIEGHSRDKAKSDTQNLMRTLEKGDITDNRFRETIRTLGFEVVERSVTIRDDTGKLHTFSTSKAYDYCKNDK
jgi:hypothetical protein